MIAERKKQLILELVNMVQNGETDEVRSILTKVAMASGMNPDIVKIETEQMLALMRTGKMPEVIMA